MSLSPDDVKQIVDAVMQTDTMKYMSSQMEAALAPAAIPRPTVQPPAPRPTTRGMPGSRQIAEEAVELAMHSRVAAEECGTLPGAPVAAPIDFNEARELVVRHWRGGAKHKYHRPRSTEIYRLEDANAHMGALVGVAERMHVDHGGKERARRAVAYAMEKGISYEDARAQLGIR